MRRIALVTALLVTLSGAPGPSAAAASHWCSDPGATPPCILSVSLNGAPVTPTDPIWGFAFSSATIGGSTSIRILVEKSGDFELGPDSLDDVWVITVDPGPIVPRVVSAAGTDLSVAHGPSSIEVTATPVIVTDNDECDPNWPWSCPETAGSERVGYLDLEITDYGAWTDAFQRESFFGLNYATNVGLRSLPPEIELDPVTGEERLLIRLANHHFRADGTTVFVGRLELRIPNLFLRRVYGIDDPATLTGVGLAPAVSGPASGSGTFTVGPEPGGGALLVEGDGLTFSNRIVRLNRGKITPTKPRKLRARRAGAVRGKLRFKPAKARGSKIRRHLATCVRPGDVVKAGAKKAPIVVKGLQAGDRYRCRVRAKAKAGFGPWARTTLRAFP